MELSILAGSPHDEMAGEGAKEASATRDAGAGSKAVSGVLKLVATPVLLPSGLASLKAVRRTKDADASHTAVLVMTARVIYHILGDREDEATMRLARKLPGMPLSALKVYFGTLRGIERMSGHRNGRIHADADRGLRSIVALRTSMIDAAVRDAVQDGIRQLLVLGAGFDTTSYKPHVVAAAGADGVGGSMRCFEIDKAETQTVKKATVERAGLPRDHVVFVSCELGKEDWLSKAREAGVRQDERTFLLWEGVTYYITKEVALETLAAFAQAFPSGSRIVFDFPFTERTAPQVLRWLEDLGEPWLFHLQSEATRDSCTQAVSDFVEAAGLTLASVRFIEKASREVGAFFAGCAVAQVP